MFPAYSIAKAGIYGLTRSLARDLGEHNIRIKLQLDISTTRLGAASSMPTLKEVDNY